MTTTVSFAAQLHPEQMPEFASRGFRSVINNRPDFEHGPDQPPSAALEEAARNAGLSYVFQPVISGAISQFDVETFARHFQELPKPVLMFCRSGARSNNLYQMAVQLGLVDTAD